MKSKKHVPTLSIGIPAYNEEGNIGVLLDSILKQKQISFVLERIYVKCDGCTDKTVNIVKALRENNSLIHVEITTIRRGKAVALNKIYKQNTSDYLMTIDADLAFEGVMELEKLITVIHRDPRIQLVGPRHVPVCPETIWGKFAYVSYRSFEDAFLRWNEGNNFYAVMSANLVRGNFSKTFVFPPRTISDQCYLYAMATRQNPYGFCLVKEAHIRFWPVSTFKDWRLLGVRSVAGDKNDLAKHFGDEILKEIAIPKTLAYGALIQWLFKSPWYTIGSICMNLYIRTFPYKKMQLSKGMWETTMSAKKAIVTK